MTQFCIFCEIVAGRAPSMLVHEDEHTYSFLSLAQATPGHTLVIPRNHAVDIFDISRDEAERVMGAAHDVAKILEEKLSPDGMTLFQANRTAGWQTVDHLHVHVVPRYADDALVTPWTSEEVSPEDLLPVHARIRSV